MVPKARSINETKIDKLEWGCQQPLNLEEWAESQVHHHGAAMLWVLKEEGRLSGGKNGLQDRQRVTVGPPLCVLGWTQS